MLEEMFDVLQNISLIFEEGNFYFISSYHSDIDFSNITTHAPFLPDRCCSELRQDCYTEFSTASHLEA